MVLQFSVHHSTQEKEKCILKDAIPALAFLDPATLDRGPYHSRHQDQTSTLYLETTGQFLHLKYHQSRLN